MNGIGEDLESYTELEKFGRLTYSREQEDIAFVLHHIKLGTLPFSSTMDLKRIGLFGHSRGGGNSILFALDHPEIRCVAVWNSIHRVNFFDANVVEEIEKNGIGYVPHARTGQQMPISREVLEDIEAHREKFNILARLPELHSPLLIVQGDHDHPRLVEGAPRMAQAAPHAILHLIQGANHTMGMKHPFAGSTPHFQEAVDQTVSFYISHFLNGQKTTPSLR
jgi:pimeloyl-ACP methyl ester carboxylesterase